MLGTVAGAACLVLALPALAEAQHRSTPVPTVRVADASAFEGTVGRRSLTLVACLSRAPRDVVSVRYATRPAGARPGADDAPRSGRMAWGPGDARCRPLHVTVVADARPEPSERVRVRLSDPVGLAVADPVAVATIRDDDRAGVREDVVVSEPRRLGPFASEEPPRLQCPAHLPYLVDRQYSRWSLSADPGIDLLQEEHGTPVHAFVHDTTTAPDPTRPGVRLLTGTGPHNSVTNWSSCRPATGSSSTARTPWPTPPGAERLTASGDLARPSGSTGST